MTPTTNSTLMFKLEEPHEFLQLDSITGQLWFKQSSYGSDSPSDLDLVVTAEKPDGAIARMSLELHVLRVDEVKDFCGEFLCFHESVTFHAIEDFDTNFKPHEIGEIAPKLYGRLCKTFEVSYELLNGKIESQMNADWIKLKLFLIFVTLASNFVVIKNNKLFASKPLNHELMSPGPELNIAVQCQLKVGSSTQLSTKVFNVSVVDRNDNLIKVQDKVTNLTLSSPYFDKVGGLSCSGVEN